MNVSCNGAESPHLRVRSREPTAGRIEHGMEQRGVAQPIPAERNARPAHRGPGGGSDKMPGFHTLLTAPIHSRNGSFRRGFRRVSLPKSAPRRLRYDVSASASSMRTRSGRP